MACQPLILGFVVPAQAGNQCCSLDSRLRLNDAQPRFQALTKHQGRGHSKPDLRRLSINLVSLPSEQPAKLVR